MFSVWWNSLSLAGQVFALIAIPSTLFLVIQTVLMLISDIGGHGDTDTGDTDVDTDIDTDTDTDFDTDVHDGVFGADTVDGDHDVSGFSGLRILTVRGVTAFLVMFGWIGIVLSGTNIPLPATVAVALAGGLITMFFIALLMKCVMKLQSDGTIDNRNALGVSGTVYLTVPPSRTGSGKVNVTVQNTYTEMTAVTDDEEPIVTGSEITVVSLSGKNTLVVTKK